MTPPILVTGGTGTLGRHVVPLLSNAGCEVRVLSRGSHQSEDGVEYVTGDLDTGEGIEAAVKGTRIILHLGRVPCRSHRLARAAIIVYEVTDSGR